MTFYAWSPGKQYVGPDQIITDWYTLGWACKWLYEDEVYSDIITSKESLARDDKRIIEAVWKFLDKADIVVTPGNGFGDNGEGYVRMALTVPVERINEAAARLQKVL